MPNVNNSSPTISNSNSSPLNCNKQNGEQTENYQPNETKPNQINIDTQSQTSSPSILPTVLQALVFRLAFSTMSNVSNPAQGFQPLLEQENPSEMYVIIYEKIKLLDQLLPISQDKALLTNKLFLEKFLLSGLQLVIKQSLPFSNLRQSSQKACAPLYNRYILRKTAHSNATLEDKLRKFSNFKVKTHAGIQLPCLPFFRPGPATLLIRFATDQHVKNYALSYWIRSVTDVADPLPGWTQEDETRLSILAVEAGGNPNSEQDGVSLLHRCANPLVARRLIKFGARTESRTKNDSQETPLHSAVKHVGVVKVLCRANVNLEARNARNETALICAISGGHWESAKFLIEAGANVDVQDDRSNTPSSLIFKYILNADCSQMATTQKILSVVQLVLKSMVPADGSLAKIQNVFLSQKLAS